MQNQGISTQITSKATSLLLYHVEIKSQKCQKLHSTSASTKSLFCSMHCVNWKYSGVYSMREGSLASKR